MLKTIMLSAMFIANACWCPAMIALPATYFSNLSPMRIGISVIEENIGSLPIAAMSPMSAMVGRSAFHATSSVTISLSASQNTELYRRIPQLLLYCISCIYLSYDTISRFSSLFSFIIKIIFILLMIDRKRRLDFLKYVQNNTNTIPLKTSRKMSK